MDLQCEQAVIFTHLHFPLSLNEKHPYAHTFTETDNPIDPKNLDSSFVHMLITYFICSLYFSCMR